MRMDRVQLLVHVISLGISFSLNLFNGYYSSTYLYYLIGYISAIGLLYQKGLQSGKRSIKLKAKRRTWMDQLIRSVLNADGHTHRYLSNTLSIKNSSEQVKSELGIPFVSLPRIYISPDVEAAEIEVVKLEERASFIIASVVFLPIAFGLIHIFRTVIISIFIIEFQVTVILAQLVLYSQTQAYQLSEWGDMYALLEDTKGKINSGHKLYSNNELLVTRPYSHELGMLSSFNDSQHARIMTASVLKSIASLPVPQRSGVLRNFMNEIQTLPKQEQLLIARWDAYRGRLLMISTVGAAISALISTLTQFNLEAFSEGIIPITTTKFLPLGMFILFQVLAFILVRPWLPGKIQFRWHLIWGMVFYMVYSISISLFRF